MRDSGEEYISYSNKWIINNINRSRSIDTIVNKEALAA